MKRIFPLLLLLGMCLALASCSNSAQNNNATANESISSSEAEETPADLTGEWKQVNSASEESYQAAIVKGDTIEIYWVDEETESFSLYWAGTFVAPETADEPYTWDSENDHDRTDSALIASSDDTKTITYEDGQLSYSASALGTTQTVKLERTDGVLDAVATAGNQGAEDPVSEESDAVPINSMLDYLDYGDVFYQDLDHGLYIGQPIGDITFQLGDGIENKSYTYYSIYADDDTSLDVSVGTQNGYVAYLIVRGNFVTMRGGITVGSSADELYEIYGKPYKSTSSSPGVTTELYYYDSLSGNLAASYAVDSADVIIQFDVSTDDNLIESILVSQR